MNKLLLSISLMLLLSGCNSSTVTVPETKPDPPAEIKVDEPEINAEVELADTSPNEELLSSIRNNYAEINTNIDNYTKTEKTLLNESTEGEEALFYYKNDDIKKIVDTSYGESGKSISNFYYKEGQLSFVFNQTYKYNQPIYYDKEMAEEFNDAEYFDIDKSEILENRYYLHENKLIMWLDKNKQEVDINSIAFQEKEIDLIQHSEKLIKAPTEVPEEEEEEEAVAVEIEKETAVPSKIPNIISEQDLADLKILLEKEQPGYVNPVKPNYTIEVFKQDGRYITATLYKNGEFVPSYPSFYAYLAYNGWRIIFSGQESPQCDEVEAISFPSDMIAQCWKDNKTIQR